MIPEGWENQSLQSVAPVIDCKHRTPTYVAIGVPIVSPGNISWGPLQLDGCRQVSEDDYSELMNHCSVKVGDLVFGRNQSVGVSSVVVDDSPFALGQDTVLIQPRKVDPAFLSQWLRSPLFENDIRRLLGGSTFGRINLKDLRHLPMSIPPAQEARRIAEILSTWDRAIETVEALIANACAQKKALMQSLLTGKNRLPGYAEEWKSKKLSQLCSVRRGASPRPITDPKWFAPTGRGWVRISDVTKSDTEFLDKTVQYLSPEGVEKSVSVEPGELIMSICATIGVPKIIGIPVCIHDGFVLFRDLSPQLSLPFLFHFLEFISEKLASGGQPGTQKNLNTSIVGNIQYPDISKQEQDDIANILNLAGNEIRTAESQLTALRQEKSALMQQLLTGKRRVRVDEREFA